MQYLVVHTESNPTAEENDPICLACANGHFNVVQYLVEQTQADSTVWDNDILCIALNNHYVNLVFLLSSLPAVQKTMDNELQVEVEQFKQTLKESYQRALAKLRSNCLLFFPSANELINDVKNEIVVQALALIQQDMGLNDSVKAYLIKPSTNRDKFSSIINALIIRMESEEGGPTVGKESDKIHQLKKVLAFVLQKPEGYFDNEHCQYHLVNDLQEIYATKLHESTFWKSSERMNYLEQLLNKNGFSSQNNVVNNTDDNNCSIQ